MSNTSIDLGVPRKDLDNGYKYDMPCCPEGGDDPAKKKEWENTICHPSFEVDGKHAMLLGADDLNVDDVVEVTFKLKVKSKRDDSKRIGDTVKRDVCIGFDILESSDLTDLGVDDDGDDQVDTGADSADAAPVKEMLKAGGGGSGY